MASTDSTTSRLCCPPLTDTINDDQAIEVAAVFKSLADPTRLKLVNIIASSGEACACDFPEALGKSQPTISHHLAQLVKAGVLEREQRGKWAWFKVRSERLADLCVVLCASSC